MGHWETLGYDILPCRFFGIHKCPFFLLFFFDGLLMNFSFYCHSLTISFLTCHQKHFTSCASFTEVGPCSPLLQTTCKLFSVAQIFEYTAWEATYLGILKKHHYLCTVYLVMYPAGAESQSLLVWKRHVSLLVTSIWSYRRHHAIPASLTEKAPHSAHNSDQERCGKIKNKKNKKKGPKRAALKSSRGVWTKSISHTSGECPSCVVLRKVRLLARCNDARRSPLGN